MQNEGEEKFYQEQNVNKAEADTHKKSTLELQLKKHLRQTSFYIYKCQELLRNSGVLNKCNIPH
jgi:hypothetical protein